MRIRVQDLHKSYRDADRDLVIVDALTYEFPEQGSLAIVGKSGVGKSTLLHLLGGLDRPSRGGVFYDTTNLSTLSDYRLTRLRGSSVGFIFQFHHLLPEFDALENAAMPLIIAGVGVEEARLKARTVLERVGLSARLYHTPGQLSGGEQQRVAIARAIVFGPKVILADEPTGNLDFRTSREVQELLLEVTNELKCALIVVTHNYDLARSLTSAVEMLPGGQLETADLSSA